MAFEDLTNADVFALTRQRRAEARARRATQPTRYYHADMFTPFDPGPGQLPKPLRRESNEERAERRWIAGQRVRQRLWGV